MSDFQPPIVDHHAPEVPDPTYETPTLTEIVDIIDLLRPWEHGFNLLAIPNGPHHGPRYMVACDCGWIAPVSHSLPDQAFPDYQRHVGYEE